ncbi:MAG: hypothetical protein K1X92_18730 [Bacteroidia bacterium]|nr:hypothetical protein [Bacteroidia bacterium]
MPGFPLVPFNLSLLDFGSKTKKRYHNYRLILYSIGQLLYVIRLNSPKLFKKKRTFIYISLSP